MSVLSIGNKQSNVTTILERVALGRPIIGRSAVNFLVDSFKTEQREQSQCSGSKIIECKSRVFSLRYFCKVRKHKLFSQCLRLLLKVV